MTHFKMLQSFCEFNNHKWNFMILHKNDKYTTLKTNIKECRVIEKI